MRNFFAQQYYRRSYSPIPLTAAQAVAHPSAYHLSNVPWIGAAVPMCQSISLQMIAAQQGLEKSRSYFDFLMGFPCGAGEIPGGPGFFPATDPETGFVYAAPYLGTVRRYYVTDDTALYLRALRSLIAQGYAVRLGLDMATLYDAPGSMPHSNVFIGSDESGFSYYEAVCRPPAPCPPCHFPAGEHGLYVTDDKLLRAVVAMARSFDYSWRYSLTVFEKSQRVTDWKPLFKRNGDSLIGGSWFKMRWGSKVFDALAQRISQQGTQFGAEPWRLGLEMSAYTRRENAAFLRSEFATEAEVLRAAELFDQAAGLYQNVHTALAFPLTDRAQVDRLAEGLHEAANLERAVGQIFLAYSGESVRTRQAVR
jgi:hypothetical protein